MKRISAFALVLVGLAVAARADEGMWTFNNFPKEKVKQKFGFKPDDKWLDHVRLSSARLAGGCSASFVSESGLVMTNHHCAHQCIQQLSTAKKDFVKSGFYAHSAADEVKCPEIEVNQLAEITDVTDRMRKVTAGLEGQKYNDAEKGEMSRIEKECQKSDRERCDVVSLYRGGLYNLYKYRRFQDVRLVFAPEFAIAFFGGDPDNFMFPRYDLDVSFLRVYEDGKPAHMDHFFKWSPAGVKEGDLTFVSGNPGRTSRQMTIAQLEYQRDVAIPESLMRLAELRGLLTEFQRRGPEQKRISNDELFGVENSYKAWKGREQALLDKTFFASKVADENALRAKVNKDPAKKKKYGGAWDAIARAQAELKKIHTPLAYLEQGRGFTGDLFHIAKTLVRGAEEREKPNDKRFRELRDSALPEVTQHLFSTAPIYDELEIEWLSFSLGKLREELGPDDPFVRKVLGKESPEEMAARLVKGTKLKDVALRRQLWDGGRAAVEASRDPLILLARQIDPDARAIRKKFDDEIEPVLKKNGELLAKARFEIYGTGDYPDATFTARLSYGQVKGWEQNGKMVPPLTTIEGAFQRATGRPPFELPASWLNAKSKLDLSTPLNFCSTNDIIGGNSGSPVVDRDAEIVGLIFDGNILSLGGDYGFDPAFNRAVAVHSAALVEALAKIYGADRIVDELRPKTTARAQ
jgi:V8-like Glu-specific endopeptidase